MSQKKILIIDDEASVSLFLKASLQSNSFSCFSEGSGKTGLQAVIDSRPDLVILDLGLPDMSGHDVLEKIRTWSQVPVIVLTVLDSETEKVRALDAGADDYLTKPFGVPELLARVRVALRHSEKKDGSAIFKSGSLEVDLSSHTVSVDGVVVSLTSTEYDILTVFVKNAGKVVTHRVLLKEVWGPNLVEHNQYVRVYVGQLRKKIKSQKESQDLILTEPGVGYRLQVL